MAFQALAIGMMLAGADLPAAQAQPALPDDSAVEVINTEPDRERRMTIPVRVGPSDMFQFVIDTGSQTTVLARDIAERMRIPLGRRARIVGIGGSEHADTVIVSELALGRRSFQDLEVVLFEGRHIGADGIVGIDSLQRQRVLLDFAKNQLMIGNARSQGGNAGFEIVVTARRRLGQLIMTDALVDGIRTDVVIDTGADTSIANRALQRALGRRGTNEIVSLVSVTGQVATAELGYPRKLTIGEVDITNLIVAYTDAPVFGALKLTGRPALLLGMRELRLFKRVAIDFGANRIYFDLPPLPR
jgi:predicted aspartyl protease